MLIDTTATSHSTPQLSMSTRKTAQKLYCNTVVTADIFKSAVSVLSERCQRAGAQNVSF